jgi:kinesin family protein 11
LLRAFWKRKNSKFLKKFVFFFFPNFFSPFRPISASEKQSRDVQVVDVMGDTVSVRSTHDDAARTYQFDGAFGPNATQLDVYTTVLEPTVDEVLAGFNCTVFAYGQTGTGKTHTMEGGMDNGGLGFSLSPDAPNAGMIQRAVHQIFKKLEHNIDIEYSVRVSHMEIYNEELVDLLAPEGGEAKPLKMLEHPTNGVCVHNLQEVPVTSSDAIFKVLRVSNKKRTTAATKMNHVSSRSHCIFTITVHTKETTIEGEEVVRVGKLNLVDLAGAENVSRSGGNKRETGNINQSLLSLGRVITSLVQQRSHVPYRESKLTRLLQESLGGRAKTSIIATVAPTASNVEETLSTLDYAHTAKSIINKPQNNNMMTKKALIKDYTSEIERLKQRLLATREKNGVYIPPEEHERMEAEMAANKEKLTELEAQLEMKTAQLEELNTMFTSARNELKNTATTLQQTTVTLDETQQKLASTHITLKVWLRVFFCRETQILPKIGHGRST